jgi:hypothetical protein
MRTKRMLAKRYRRARPSLLDDRSTWVFKCLIVIGIFASLAHFADNAFEIGHYPEPTWITPGIVLLAWIPDALLPLAAIVRRRGDLVFVLLAAAFGVLLLTGLAHYAYGSPFRMAMLSNFTILFEALVGVALLSTLWWSLAWRKASGRSVHKAPREGPQKEQMMRLSATSILVAFGILPVALVGLTHACDAKIVYTPTNQVLVNNGSLPIDANNDGHADFTIYQHFETIGCLDAYSAIQPAAGNGVVSGYSGPSGPWAAALGLGTFVGNSQPFTSSTAILRDQYDSPGCPFPHGYGYYGSGYVGVAFLINGKMHFGWAQLTVVVDEQRFFSKITTTLSGYAYQTVAGRSIPAGRT